MSQLEAAQQKGEFWIDITFHAKKRYAERVLMIEDEKEAIIYTQQNEVKIGFEIMRLFKKATLYYDNFSLDTGHIKHIYIYEDILFIVGQNLSLVTLWRIPNYNGDGYFSKMQHDLKRIRINKGNRQYLYKQIKLIDIECDKIDFAINQFDEIINDFEESGFNFNSAINIVKDRKSKLLDKKEKIINDKTAHHAEIKALKDENTLLMKAIMYGFVI